MNFRRYMQTLTMMKFLKHFFFLTESTVPKLEKELLVCFANFNSIPPSLSIAVDGKMIPSVQ